MRTGMLQDDANGQGGLGLAFAVIILVALVLRALCALALGEITPGVADDWEYGEIAQNFVRNGEMARAYYFPDGEKLRYPSTFMPPGHVFLWIGLFWIFDVTPEAYAAMLVINVACSVGIVAMTGLLARRIFQDRLVGLLAAGLVAVYPTFIYSVATYHAIQVYVLLFLAGLHLMLALIETRSGRSAVLLGIAGGVATLWRSEYMVLFAALILYGFWRHRSIRLFALAVGCAALVVLPWTARNYVVHERFIPIANSSGWNAWKGFNPEMQGSGNAIEASDYRIEIEREVVATLPRDDTFETAMQDAFMERAGAFIAAEPVRAFVELPAQKLALFWVLDWQDPEVTLHPVYVAAFVPTFVLSIGGIVLVLRRRPVPHGAQAMLWVFVAQSVVVSGYAVHARYRMNVEPFLFMFAAVAGAALIRHWLARRAQG
ncbi:MAG: glycosyltransferase family 39 protein [Pseudomonadota bacterium]